MGEVKSAEFDLSFLASDTESPLHVCVLFYLLFLWHMHECVHARTHTLTRRVAAVGLLCEPQLLHNKADAGLGLQSVAT